MKLVSACLAGKKCRFDGTAKPHAHIIELVKRGQAIAVCPEQLAGLPTPRAPVELKKGLAHSRDGKDFTLFFELGARKALDIARRFGCNEAILKARSPSCGSGLLFDGSFSGKLAKGDGVFAALLKREGIKVISKEELE